MRNLFVLITLLGVSTAFAEESARHILVSGRKSATVTTSGIRLGDLAEVTSPRVEDDEAVIGLKKIWIETSPRPGQEITLSAAQVLEKVRVAGVNLDEIGYTLPRMISVKRAARILTMDEITSAITEAITSAGKDVALKRVEYRNDISIAPGFTTIKAIPAGPAMNGRINFAITADTDGGESAKFNIPAIVEEFKEIPTAKHQIAKGKTVAEDDITMGRFNIDSLPKDAASSEHPIVGMAADYDIAAGEVFRSSKLSIPVVISSGSKVTMVFRKGLLEATATGIAMENGGLGQDIKVRNEDSKKIISGRVLEPGLVGVNQ